MNGIIALILMSVAAADGGSVAATRPAWVGAKPGLRDGVYEVDAYVGPEATREECERKLMPMVRSAVEDYAQRWKDTNGYRGENLPIAGYSDDVLARTFIAEKWEEHVKIDGVNGIFLHARLKFNAELQQEWRAAANEWLTERRSLKLTAMFLLAMWGVGVAHVALRVDGLIAARSAEEAKPARLTRAMLWGTAGLLTAIPLLVVS